MTVFLKHIFFLLIFDLENNEDILQAILHNAA